MADAPAYLVTGSEELLVRRAADRILEALGREGDLDVTDVRAEELRDQPFPDLRTGSLFGNPRAVRVRDAQDLAAGHVTALLEQLDGSPPEATVVLQASGTGKLRKLAKRIDELGGRIDASPPKEWEDKRWLALVAEEFERHGRKAQSAAQHAVLDHAGLEAGIVAEKVSQVVAAAPSGTITAEHVESVVVGHGDRGAFAVADAMCDRDPATAVARLRGVLEGGQDPLMILGALTYRIRTVVAVAGGVTGKADDGGVVGVSGPQARRLEGVKRNFGPGELTGAYRTLADADLAIKQSDLPPELVIERAVAQIATRA